ncbi:AKAP7 2'5' RNA ligase-like domain-containing protein [Talaromyces proteolyticus]|uniref:AKAP7 2'5' RNA ligase-like domain-containing protein n=1 Tax=Talaromyces proteolyticus TaxID=1131652 RepID=A0AAD4Q0Y3_9EURO|nr:AKAP7 2'5' RNA ligase-like domain-containing protein [Talaromyces proteolyticus]KAH8697698.1 AKAP7 2'5' RNA ligase-like domain-containing protein [Talaromyces proteolyticus]
MKVTVSFGPTTIIAYSTRPTFISITSSPRARYATMSRNSNSQGGGKRLQTKEKRPPLTHFLCFPLVTEHSLPLLERSFADFKNNIPLRRKTLASHSMKPRPPLFPDSAIRPLGTLHLTLGVMSLPTPERVNEAVSFLHSISLEEVLRETESEIINSPARGEQQKSSGEVIQSTGDLAPISVSLESLHALPRAKAATVLYAKPVDPTSRLYPFGVKLRQRFIDAGFIQPDYLRRKNSRSSNKKESGINQPIQQPGVENEYTPNETPKLRPLLLHATVVNTIYARGGDSHPNGGRDRRRAGPLTFDARAIITHHNDYYTDETCAEEKKHDFDDDDDAPDMLEEASSSSENNETGSLSAEEGRAHPSKMVQEINSLQVDNDMSGPKYPFVWARNFHIEKLCICEMGAKMLDEDGDPLAARLGQKYSIVAEKSLLISK